MGDPIRRDGDTDHTVQPMDSDLAVTYRMTVSYDGKDFAGWQVQPGQRTVQGCIQDGLGRLMRHPVVIHGSGRTDTGVHATGQVFHFRTHTTIPIERMVKAVNASLPMDIAVLDVAQTGPEFHARYDVVEKTYQYRILNTSVRNPLLQHYAWHVPERIDIARIEDSFRHLTGTHDFAGFAASGSPRSTTVRTLSRAGICRHGDEILMEFTADGFLYHMVRNLAGTLTEIGMGRKEASWIDQILQGKDRSLAGKTAPPQGLYLMMVKY